MRNIKFRAWWKDPKWKPKGGMYMVGGFHNVVEHDYEEPERDVSDKPQEVYLVESLPTVAKINWNDAKDMKLMQFTGLKDKNGKEIYEGDIVETETGLYQVVWGYQQCSFYLGIVKGYSSTALQMYQAMDNEVIGNIYENPDLVAGE